MQQLGKENNKMIVFLGKIGIRRKEKQSST